ncbi:MAG: hypothetical protein J6C46_01790 [Clostridia bacterium]|nr:hypothetical protein [Clostridia bacterium]
MYTISELARNKVIIHDNNSALPFVIEQNRNTTISGNAFGTYSFEIMNADEVYLHLANPILIPEENLGKLNVICSNGTGNSRPCKITIPITEVYVISKERFFDEKMRLSFSSPEAWLALKAKLDAEAAAEAANPVKDTESHPKLNPADFL